MSARISEPRAGLAGLSGLLRTVSVFSLAVNLLVLTAPLYMLQVYDRVIPGRPRETMVTLTILAASLYTVMGVLEHVRSRLAARIGATVQAQLDGRVFRAMLSQPHRRAQIDPTYIDQAAAGQRATLRFTSFDARTTPELAGNVAAVSADAYEDPKYGRRYYKADIRIDPEELAKLGPIVLLPAMPVESFIQTGDRSALSYFVNRMSDYFNRALPGGLNA